MSRVPKSTEDLNKQLSDQLELLDMLVQAYDDGKTVAAKSMASSIRVLVHDTPKSHALLQQLGELDRDFYNTAEIRDVRNDGGTWAGSYSALISIAFGGTSSGFVPNLDSNSNSRSTPFVDYWNEIIFVDDKKNSFTRRDIVLAIANQDGGSHVDPGLDPKYEQLSRKNSLGFLTGNGTDWNEVEGAELASVRQIAHEFLKTLKPGYITPARKGDGAIMGGIGMVLHTTPPNESLFDTGPRRQGPCPCGSGKKYKRCHGK